MSEALKPCPFCGGERQTIKSSSRWGWFVSCACTTVGPGKATKEGAIKAWNTREEPKQGRLEL